MPPSGEAKDIPHRECVCPNFECPREIPHPAELRRVSGGRQEIQIEVLHYSDIGLTMFYDYGLIKWMKEVAISEFKAKCLSLLDEVQKTKKPILVTRFGKPIAEVGPAPTRVGASWLGSMKDEIKILGDIVSPANDEDEWEALRD